MVRAISHRGPDGYGIAVDRGAGFVSARLAIVDIEGGWQPLAGNDSLLTYNGEVYNHPELRRMLHAAGVRCTTTSDTEVVLRLLEHEGLDALRRLNGQFAFAWWQPRERRLTLVRDRFGVRPLHYAVRTDESIVFGSEAKALFASGEVRAAPDLAGLDDVFTLWGARAPRTVFDGVRQLRPGSLLVWEAGRIVADRSWWRPDHTGPRDAGIELRDALQESVRLRLRADVPVGAYLSGGVDSSLIAALARRMDGSLRTFSVAFHDPGYDERAFQERVAAQLGTEHTVVEIGQAEMTAEFPAVIRHTETPLVRTAPTPMFLLSRSVDEHGIKTVITGEGADELFWGYDLFKEVLARQLAARDPAAARALIDRLYPDLTANPARRGPAWQRFVLEAADIDEPLGSHMTRALATQAVKAFYRPSVAEQAARMPSLTRLHGELPTSFGTWPPLDRAAWLELHTLLEPYLLSAQGDRVAMAHGVEGRFPFLDHHVYELAAALPAERKLDGRGDKVVLRELAADLLPSEIADRPKRPYRAPEIAPFVAPGAPAWVEDALAPAALNETGMWDATRVRALVERCRAGKARGAREAMAFVGVLSTQLWYEAFIGRRAGDAYPPETAEPRIRLDYSTAERKGDELVTP